MHRATGQREIHGVTEVAFMWAVVAAGIAAAILAVGYAVRHLAGVDGSLLYRDANAIAGQPFYYGLLECMTASLLLMSGAILSFETIRHRGTEARRRFLALTAFAGLTVLLGIDDLVMIHEIGSLSGPQLRNHPRRLRRFVDDRLCSGPRRNAAIPFRPARYRDPDARPRRGRGCVQIKPLGIGLEDYVEIVGFSFWSTYMLARAVAPAQSRHIEAATRLLNASLSRARV